MDYIDPRLLAPGTDRLYNVPESNRENLANRWVINDLMEFIRVPEGRIASFTQSHALLTTDGRIERTSILGVGWERVLPAKKKR